MKRFSRILIGSILLGSPILPERAAAQATPAGMKQAFVAPFFFRGSAKCLRNPHCRKAVAERAKKLRDRLDRGINEFTFGTLQQLHDLLGGYRCEG